MAAACVLCMGFIFLPLSLVHEVFSPCDSVRTLGISRRQHANQKPKALMMLCNDCIAFGYKGKVASMF